MRALARSHQQPAPEKQNVPPFRGGTWQPFYARGDNCQPVTPQPALPLTFRCRGKIQLQCLADGTCGRTHADSCAGVTPYCSLWAVGYDISCGSSDPLGPSVRRTRSGALAAPGEG